MGVQCCKANHTTDITLHTVKNWSSLYVVKYSTQQIYSK